MHELARPIVIFDSGVGGLSIYQEIKQALPGLRVIYCSDTAAFPYGPKTEEEVVDRTSFCLGQLAQKYHPALAVIACNTASTISLPRVRRELDIPIVGVVPAIKTASEQSRNRCIGLLATPGTIQRGYTDQLIKDFADDCQVIRVGSSDLVYLAEQHLRGERVSADALEKVIKPFFVGGYQPDAIVLGCTHFPLLKDELAKVSPTPVKWIDSGAAIAHRVESLLEGKIPGQSENPDIFVHTGIEEQVTDLLPMLEKMGFSGPVAISA